MVATVEMPAVKARKFAHGPKGGLTPDQKLEVRTLYLAHNKGAKDISTQLGVDYKSTCDLITRAGWAKIRNKRWDKAEAEITAIVDKDMAQVVQRITVESEELAMGSLRVLRNSIARGNAKDMQMASGAARNLVDIARKCRGLDNKLEQATGSTVNLNFFALGKTEAPQKNVTPKPIEIG